MGEIGGQTDHCILHVVTCLVSQLSAELTRESSHLLLHLWVTICGRAPQHRAHLTQHGHKLELIAVQADIQQVNQLDSNFLSCTNMETG